MFLQPGTSLMKAGAYLQTFDYTGVKNTLAYYENS
jgi:hypothetical protein